MTVCTGPRDAADNPPSCCAFSGVSELVSRDKTTQEGFLPSPPALPNALLPHRGPSSGRETRERGVGHT